MRLGIVGSREYPYPEEVRDYIKRLPKTTIVVTGGARGVDRIAEDEARKNGLIVVVHRADWNKYGKRAGAIRNKVLVDDCDQVVAFWDGTSPGTKDSMRYAAKKGKLLKVFMSNQISMF